VYNIYNTYISSGQTYRIEFTPAAARQFRKMDPQARRQVAGKMESLRADPRGSGTKPLTGKLAGLWRLRSGDYRVVYAIKEWVVTIEVIAVGNRKDVYRLLG
jgi:mRNA interferase RelE/StbE